jgi:hypothetical protein
MQYDLFRCAKICLRPLLHLQNEGGTESALIPGRAGLPPSHSPLCIGDAAYCSTCLSYPYFTFSTINPGAFLLLTA